MEGIDIKTEDGTVLGKSKVAAKTAVAQVRNELVQSQMGLCPCSFSRRLPARHMTPTHTNMQTLTQTQVVPSRILMATPGMFFPPMIMSRLEKSALLKASPGLGAPIMVRA